MSIETTNQKQLEKTENETLQDAGPLNKTFFAKLKTILYFNPLFSQKDYNFGFGQEKFTQLCEVQNCFTTNNRSLLGKKKLKLLHLI